MSGFTGNPARLLRLRDKGTIGGGVGADLVVRGEDASVRRFRAGGRCCLSDGEVMMHSTTGVRIQEPNA